MNLAETWSEDEFLDMIMQRARAQGWLVHHDKPAPTPDGRGKWITHVAGDPGFPDLLMARRGQWIFAEVKDEKGRVSPKQQAWLEALGGMVWRPHDWPAICDLLDA